MPSLYDQKIVLPEEILREQTILVIDDDPDVVFTTTLMLEEAGYRVLSGTTAADAAEMTRIHHPALILLDVELPDGNGIDEARKIKQDPELSSVFVTLLSGVRISPQEQAKGLRAGLADAYIVRPFTKIDFLARIEAFLRIRASQELLRLQNSELESFTYTVSHDLKSPLHTIQAFAELIELHLDSSTEDIVKESLTHICSAAKKMDLLLSDLLKISQAGNLTYKAEPVNLTKVVDEALESIRGLLSTRPIDLQIMRPLPTITGDHNRLCQVMQNLLENAVKYMGKQPAPRIEIGSAESVNGQACYIKDNGQGIPLEFQSKIFGLFERLSQDDKGTGVGLALVKRIIERHGGHIWVESQGIDQGSTFWFTLPCESPSLAD